MTVLRGAFDPSGMLKGVQIEHVFCAAHDLAWAELAIAQIAGRGRTALITIEPWQGHPNEETIRRWRDVLAGPGAVYVRYQHEMNALTYPWAGDPASFVAAWRDFAAAMPGNVVKVWAPNVSFPGSRPIADYWPGAEFVDAVGLSGYARHGESFRDVFDDTLEELYRLPIAGKPLWICETGTPRGKGQTRFWRDGMAWAESQGIAAVVAFNVDKDGPDERAWALSKTAQRAFLGAGDRNRRGVRA